MALHRQGEGVSPVPMDMGSALKNGCSRAVAGWAGLAEMAAVRWVIVGRV
jgi:hypothetical protein